jgi:hypothetical protein
MQAFELAMLTMLDRRFHLTCHCSGLFPLHEAWVGLQYALVPCPLQLLLPCQRARHPHVQQEGRLNVLADRKLQHCCTHANARRKLTPRSMSSPKSSKLEMVIVLFDTSSIGSLGLFLLLSAKLARYPHAFSAAFSESRLCRGWGALPCPAVACEQN